MAAHVGEPEGTGIGDQQAEHPATAREIADDAVRVRVDARGDEVGEVLACLVEDPDARRIARRELACDVEQPWKDPFQFAFRDDRSPCLDQSA